MQRVKQASVTVADKKTGSIAFGLLLFVGFTEEDNQEDFAYVIRKLLGLRIFDDENGVMNESVKEQSADILLVSQFTLMASTKKGNRPSYRKASPPKLAKLQYQDFHKLLEKEWHKTVPAGVFGAHMDVNFTNSGPVTILLDSQQKDF